MANNLDKSLSYEQSEKRRMQTGVPTIPTDIKFTDFSPDVDPITPGAILDMGNLYSTAKGFRPYPSLAQYSLTALPGPCLGAFAGYLGSTFVIVAGTATGLFILNNSTLTWTPQGVSISGGVTKWTFDIYGGLLIAANGVDHEFVYTGTGFFTPLGGNPPVASIVQATDFDLFLIPPNSRDFWFSLSATIWTPSIATQTVHGSLDSTNGNITAAQRIRSGQALYKRNAIHMGQFTIPPYFWEFHVVSEQVGVGGQYAVANLGDVNYFPGTDDFYSFDGYSLNRIQNNLKEWFFRNLDGDHVDAIVARWDEQKSLIFWHFPSINANPAGSLDMWICLNIRSGKWTANSAAAGIEFPIFNTLQVGGLTYGAFGTRYGTYGGIPQQTYGQLRAQNQRIPGVIATDHSLQIYNGESINSSLTTHDFGDRHNMFQVTRLRPQFAVYPRSGTLQVMKQYIPGVSSGPPQTLFPLSSDGWFNFISTARLQRFQMNFPGDYEICALEAEADYAGER
jgi:hypothetical protein